MADVQWSSECGSVFLASNSQENKHYQVSDLQKSDGASAENALQMAAKMAATKKSSEIVIFPCPGGGGGCVYDGVLWE